MTDNPVPAISHPNVNLSSAGTLSGRKILVYGMNYAPEMAGVGKYTADIARHFAENGAEVHVVTAPPHYPGWHVLAGHANRYGRSREGAIIVFRTPLLLRRQMAGVWRLLAPLSFALSSAPVVFWQIVKIRPHSVFCVEPTLLAAPVAQLAAWIVRARTFLHVQDLEVDAAFAMGHLGRWPILHRLALAYERFLLKRFDEVITISSRMAEKLRDKGVAGRHISVVRNWVDLDHIFPLDGVSPYRRELGLCPEDFVVLYSGNIGAKQGLNVLLDAAKILADQTHIKIVIAGEGPEKAALMARYGAMECVRFLPFQPQERFNDFLNLADLHALIQGRDAADLVLPSKLGGMLATGKPILATAGEGSELHNFLGDAAVFAEAGSASSVAGAVSKIARDRLGYRSGTRHTLADSLARDSALQRLLHMQTRETDLQGVQP